MTLTQIAGAVLVSLSAVLLCVYGVRQFFTSILSDAEAERSDLAQQASPCQQTLGRFTQ